jgi:23S rRNA pseudouridine2605 synthase
MNNSRRPVSPRKKKTTSNKTTGNKPAGFSPRRPKEPKADALQESWPMRLNKYIAHCGICSRRQAAELVKKGQVTVNGTLVQEPGVEIHQRDEVSLKGQAIKPEERKVYILINKPKNVITTAEDERGRKTVLDILRGKVKERVYPVGRLDRDTTGLLLLTNDGDLAQRLAHPKHKISKVYKATLDKNLSAKHFEEIMAGVELEDGKALVNNVFFYEEKKNEVGIDLHIGKNRIVRRIFEHLGYEVKSLDRVFYAGLTKKDLPRGFFRRLTEREIIQLKHFS